MYDNLSKYEFKASFRSWENENWKWSILHNFQQRSGPIWADRVAYLNFLHFSKNKTRWTFFIFFSKIVHQKGLFEKNKKKIRSFGAVSEFSIFTDGRSYGSHFVSKSISFHFEKYHFLSKRVFEPFRFVFSKRYFDFSKSNFATDGAPYLYECFCFLQLPKTSLHLHRWTIGTFHWEIVHHCLQEYRLKLCNSGQIM